MSRFLAGSRLQLLKDGWSSATSLAWKERCLAAPRSVVRGLASESGHTEPSPTQTVKVLYDGGCRLCEREISMLRRIARHKPVEFVDINTPQFSPDRYAGVTYHMAMKEMHVIAADGKVHIQGDAVRAMYRASGLGWVVAMTELPVVASVFDALYLRFAAYRLRTALQRCDTGDACSIKLKHLRDQLKAPKTP